ncbi:LysR family transcriptional regulator [Amylibacter sp. SFDW26]|uniref:LysR family transcriptional regulator n=1 Tax=Amylibacter sp. SFDW26 TaxID=2652722 RepID=UPI0012615C8B|nr:LysR family transcriptional regulator [Amylibacter sp. SFDW26]KAB7610031.1 LysR family transcriptional regulator [Amylibacter sp. SFDW26]
MDILWLKDFESLAAQKNFSRAAEERNVSQPAFSRRIRTLEDTVGAKLINRQTLPLSLTPAGEIFLTQARSILRTYTETLERCRNIEAANESVIRFATSQSLYITHYKTHIAPLLDSAGLDIDLNSTSWVADQFVTALLQRYCDVILTYWHPSMDFLAPLEVAKCEYITLSRDKLIPVTRPKPNGDPLYPLPSQNKKPLPLLAYDPVSALHPVMKDILSNKLNNSPMLVVNQNALATSIKAMIAEEFGLGWLPQEICKNDLKTGRLVHAGDTSYASELEIRLYREKDNIKPSLNKLWDKLKI